MILLLLLPPLVLSQCPQSKIVGGGCSTIKSESKDTSDYKPEIDGQNCNRDCTQTNENLTCIFNFTLKQMFSDKPGRFADGHNRSVLLFNGQLPGPNVVVCEGDDIVVNLKNKLTGNEVLLGAPSKEAGHTKLPYNSTTLHFHGIRELQPSGFGSWSKGGSWSDGVPLVTQCPIHSGDTFTYRILGSGSINSDYNNAPAGTYWYHSHVGRQRLIGAQGKLIIMPRKMSTIYDVDLPENSLFLQEWYPNTTYETAQSLLINGKGKQSKTHQALKCDSCMMKYKHGHPSMNFGIIDNPNYDTGNKTNYEVFNITKPGKRYRFRIIGGIGDNVPIRVSVEGHTFSVIATDSVEIDPVENVDAIWVASGERYDIVINTKNISRKDDPYKIQVVHLTSKQPGVGILLCSLAWLRYKGQTVDNSIMADCDEMKSMTHKKVVNPVPVDYSKWAKSAESESTNYIYPANLSSCSKPKGIENILNTQYISMHGMKFNNFSMSFPSNYSDVPVLFQSPSDAYTKRCGPVCSLENDECKILDQQCPQRFPHFNACDCQHVVQQPWAPGYWFETIFINVKEKNGREEDGWGVAHPIHQHGGWFNIVGMGQFDYPIFRDTIIEMDKKCEQGHHCLPRNLDNPAYKDVVQVPTNGYVIIRTPLDNRGAWIVHCHISWHGEHGMAMILQIGQPDGAFRWSMGSNSTTSAQNLNKNCFR